MRLRWKNSSAGNNRCHKTSQLRSFHMCSREILHRKPRNWFSPNQSGFFFRFPASWVKKKTFACSTVQQLHSARFHTFNTNLSQETWQMLSQIGKTTGWKSEKWLKVTLQWPATHLPVCFSCGQLPQKERRGDVNEPRAEHNGDQRGSSQGQKA